MNQDNEAQVASASEGKPQEDLKKLKAAKLLDTYDAVSKNLDTSLGRMAFIALRDEVLRRLNLLDTIIIKSVPEIAKHLAQGFANRTRLLALTDDDRIARIEPDTRATSDP